MIIDILDNENISVDAKKEMIIKCEMNITLKKIKELSTKGLKGNYELLSSVQHLLIIVEKSVKGEL